MSADVHHLHVSYEAEQSIVGGIMLTNGRALNDVLDTITSRDFHSASHRAIYETILKLDGKDQSSDAVTVAEQLEREGMLDAVGGRDYLATLVEQTPSAANIGRYADILRERSLRRQIEQAGVYVRDLSEDPREIEEVLSEAQRRVLDVGNEAVRGGPMPVSSFVSRFIDELDQRHNNDSRIMGISTGFRDLDKKINGLQRGNLIVIAGRPSMGKTGLALNIARHVTMQLLEPSVIFSMEMSADEIMNRLVAQTAKVPMHMIMSGDLDEEKWSMTSETLSELARIQRMEIDESPALLMSQLKARCRRVKQRHGSLGVIVVDYLQLMGSESRTDNRAQQISDITRGLKSLAKEMDAPVIVLSQLNREVDKREDKRPRMSDLRESGSIEQDSDLILFVYREVVYNENAMDPKVAEIIIGKQRNGPIGTVLMYFFGEYTMFGQMESDAQQQFWHRKLASRGGYVPSRSATDDEPF